MQWKDYKKCRGKYALTQAFGDIPASIYYIRGIDYTPTFSIQGEDHDGLLSMEKLFLQYYKDPTEYLFVKDVFDGDWDHWNQMKATKIVAPLYARWKRDAEAKLLAEVMGKVVETAFDDNNKNSFAAQKWLIERGNKTTAAKPVGRPKKDKKEPEVDNADLLKDIERLKNG